MSETGRKKNIELEHTVYIALGANMDKPSDQIMRALETISGSFGIELMQYSSLYLSQPMGPQTQDDYVNAVAKLRTSLTPFELLDRLQSIETAQGRVRKQERWGPRILDLDLLLYNNNEIQHPRLTVPHYGMKDRNFVLLPLVEIAPELQLPDGTKIKELVERINQQGIERLC